MNEIRCVYSGAPPAFPVRDQHPSAQRYGPIAMPDGSIVYVDAIGAQPSVEQIAAVLGTKSATAATAAPAAAPVASATPAAARLDRHLTVAISELSAPQPAAPGKPVMTSPSVAGLNVKQMMEEHTHMMGEIHKAQLALLQSSLARQRDTLSTAVTTVAQKIDGQTDEFLSIMGQFANDLGLDE